MSKNFLTFDQQIELLRDTKGLIVEDIDLALLTLKTNNYYRLNAYFHQFLRNDIFIAGTTFNQILNIYNKDRLIRRAIIKYLEKIEIQARCQIGHELGRAYGPQAFFKCEIFKSAPEWENLQASFRKATIRDENDPVATHYYNDLEGDFEIWVVVEYLSFGELSRLFGICDTRIQAKISESFQVHETLVKSWLESLSILRNVCAHYGYLHLRIFPTSPAIPKTLQTKVSQTRLLFSHIIALSWLLDSNSKSEFLSSIADIEADWQNYGFPDNWIDLLM